MPYSKSGYQASVRYKEKNIKRVPLDMQITDYERLKSAADAVGEAVNTYIKTAIDMRMKQGKV